MPVSLLFSELGLRLLRWLPMVLPLGVFLGLLLSHRAAVPRFGDGRAHPSVGRSPRDLLRPLSLVAVPAADWWWAICSLWAGPWAQHTSRAMIADADRSRC